VATDKKYVTKELSEATEEKFEDDIKELLAAIEAIMKKLPVEIQKEYEDATKKLKELDLATEKGLEDAGKVGAEYFSKIFSHSPTPPYPRPPQAPPPPPKPRRGDEQPAQKPAKSASPPPK